MGFDFKLSSQITLFFESRFEDWSGYLIRMLDVTPHRKLYYVGDIAGFSNTSY